MAVAAGKSALVKQKEQQQLLNIINIISGVFIFVQCLSLIHISEPTRPY